MPQTYHAWVLGLQRDELPKRCHVGRLRWGRRGWRVQDVVVTGDEVGVGLVGHGELLHGARLDQLLREERWRIFWALGWACACDKDWGP